MSDPNDTIQFQVLLATHRRALHQLLLQSARFGIFTPPHVRLDIEDRRAQIAQLKADLIAAGAVVANRPGDLPGSARVERRRLFVNLLYAGILSLVVLAAIVIVTGGVSGIRRQLDQWGVVPFTSPERPGETLIVIAPFYVTEGNRNTEAHREIRRAIQSAATALGLSNLRVEIALTALRADDRAAAEALADRTNASIVIWGDDTGARIAINFLNRSTPQLPIASVSINEIQRTQLANPSAYAQYIVHDLPGQMSFLSLFAIGQSHFAAGNYDDATRLIERAIASLPLNTVIEGLADAYFRLGWLYSVHGHDEKKALQNFELAITSDPMYASAYNNRGVIRGTNDDLDGALQDFSRTIDLAPKDPFAYSNRGIIYHMQEKIANARQDFDASISLGMKNGLGYSNRGYFRYTQGDIDGALQDFDQAVTVTPNDAVIYYNRATFHVSIGHLSGAREDFDQAIALNPDFAYAYINRGTLRKEQGDFTGARQDYDRAIALDPTDADAFYNRAIVRVKQGDVEGALEDYSQAILLKPTYTVAYINRGSLYHKQSNYDAAVSDYNAALAIEQDNVVAYFNRGLAYEKRGDRQLAVADYEQVIKIGTDPALSNLAKEHLRQLH